MKGRLHKSENVCPLGWKCYSQRELIGAACWLHNLRKAFEARNNHQ